MKKCRYPVIAFAVLAALAVMAASAGASSASASGTSASDKVDKVDKCHQAPAGGGPISADEVIATSRCFDALVSGLHVYLFGAVAGPVNSCPDLVTTADGRQFLQEAAAGIKATAKEGRHYVEKTDEAKEGYFEAEYKWYKQKGRDEVADRIDIAINAIGRLASQISTVYAGAERVASALRSLNCGPAQTHLQAARGAYNKAHDMMMVLASALGDIAVP